MQWMKKNSKTTNQRMKTPKHQGRWASTRTYSHISKQANTGAEQKNIRIDKTVIIFTMLPNYSFSLKTIQKALLFLIFHNLPFQPSISTSWVSDQKGKGPEIYKVPLKAPLYPATPRLMVGESPSTQFHDVQDQFSDEATVSRSIQLSKALQWWWWGW